MDAKTFHIVAAAGHICLSTQYYYAQRLRDGFERYIWLRMGNSFAPATEIAAECVRLIEAFDANTLLSYLQAISVEYDVPFGGFSPDWLHDAIMESLR